MKSIVSTLVLAAVIVGANAAPATTTGAVAHAGSSTTPAVAQAHGKVAVHEHKSSSVSEHGTHNNQHALLTSNHHAASSTHHESKKEKKQRKKLRKNKHHENKKEESEKAKEHATTSHNTLSTSHTETSAAHASNPKSEPRDFSEFAEPVYARGKKSKKARKARKSRKAKKLQQQQEAEASQSTEPAPQTAMVTRELEEGLEGLFERDVFESAEPVYARGKKSKKSKKSRKSRKAKKLQQLQEAEASQSTEPSSQQAMATRDFEEALEARLFENFRAKMKEAKIRRLRKDYEKAQAEADAAAIAAGMTPHGQLHSKESTEHTTRDFLEEEFEARDLGDFEDLEARNRLLRSARKHHGVFTEAARIGVDAALNNRELEDLEVRNRLLRSARKHHGVFTEAARIGVDAALNNRDVEDELAARDYFDEELDARSIGDFFAAFRKESPKDKAIRLEHKAEKLHKELEKAEAEASGTKHKREFIDDELEMREFDDQEDLLARGYFDDSELEARTWAGFKMFEAIENAFTPKHAGGGPAPAAPSADGEPKAREFLDEFDLRDFVEVDELD